MSTSTAPAIAEVHYTIESVTLGLRAFHSVERYDYDANGLLLHAIPAARHFASLDEAIDYAERAVGVQTRIGRRADYSY